VDAGYMVLEAAVPEEISTLENATQDESLTLYATTKDGDMYTLLYHGISEDGSVYLFTLTTPDGTEQSWTAAVDSSGVVQNK
jgi:hypothetical protein